MKLSDSRNAALHPWLVVPAPAPRIIPVLVLSQLVYNHYKL
jgi:hypothetical protein